MVLIMDFGTVSYSQIITQIIISISVSYYLLLSKKHENFISKIKSERKNHA